MEGWIKLHRKIVDNPYYFSEPFTRSQAWIDLLILANHKDNFYYIRGVKVDVKRGQIGHSLENLAKRFRWSRGKTERFISELEMANQIVRQKNNVTTLFTVVNYEEYQQDSNANNKTNSKADGQQIVKQTVKQTDINKNVKNDNNEKNDKDISSNFAETSSANPEYVDADSQKTKKASMDSVKAKKEKPTPKPPTPFPGCMAVYSDFIIQQMGLPPKIDGQEGKALNSIIKYLTTITTGKEPEGIVNAFKYILVNKSKWDPFHQNQLKISQINSNLTNIINSIKNGTAKKSVTANNYDNNKYRTANTESAM